MAVPERRVTRGMSKQAQNNNPPPPTIPTNKQIVGNNTRANNNKISVQMKNLTIDNAGMMAGLKKVVALPPTLKKTRKSNPPK